MDRWLLLTLLSLTHLHAWSSVFTKMLSQHPLTHPDTHTHTHIHSHIHTHIHTHIYAYVYTHTSTHTHIYTHTHIGWYKISNPLEPGKRPPTWNSFWTQGPDLTMRTPRDSPHTSRFKSFILVSTISVFANDSAYYSHKVKYDTYSIMLQSPFFFLQIVTFSTFFVTQIVVSILFYFILKKNI